MLRLKIFACVLLMDFLSSLKQLLFSREKWIVPFENPTNFQLLVQEITSQCYIFKIVI